MAVLKAARKADYWVYPKADNLVGQKVVQKADYLASRSVALTADYWAGKSAYCLVEL